MDAFAAYCLSRSDLHSTLDWVLGGFPTHIFALWSMQSSSVITTQQFNHKVAAWNNLPAVAVLRDTTNTHSCCCLCCL